MMECWGPEYRIEGNPSRAITTVLQAVISPDVRCDTCAHTPVVKLTHVPRGVRR